jgi:DNA helicase-2/ATP-dependent DNA helicase PcrA
MDLATLNTPQREAVTHVSGPLLVLAGAGSGKTRVITFRIVELINKGVDPRHIAALTFTNKAAGEMRERVGDLLGNKQDAAKLTMGTFHSLGLQILKAERKALGYPRGFVIYDTSDQLGVIREILRRLRNGDRRYDVKSILSRISLAKNAFISPEDYQIGTGDEYDEITAEVYGKYQAALRNFAAVDFDDLITEVVNLFHRNEEVRERWAGKFRFLLVDEYQDTNRAQLMMIRTLIEKHNNLCVVGDDDQSIYSWRGADTGNILGFGKMFPGAKIIKLEQNYRSTPNILTAANAVIANNQDRYGKTLWSAHDEGVSITHAVAPDSAGEARFVALEIEKLHSEKQWPYKNFAILYRSNLQAKIIEEELLERQIPYAMFGGQQFFERKEVKDLIAYLRVSLNPRDEIALRRIVNYPSRGIGGGTLERLTKWCAAKRMPLWNGLVRIQELEGVRPGIKRSVAEFTEMINRLGTELERGSSVVAQARELMDTIDLYGDLRSASPTMKAAQKRIDNVESLLSSLARHQERDPGRTALIEYLRKLSLENSDDEAQEAGNCVTMTTLHGSKGLEFPVVFLVGWEEELLPHARSLMPTAADISDPEHSSDVGEERRLAYVGITRAQQVLYVSRSVVRVLRGKQIPRTPSRFLTEIPPELLTERNIADELQAPVEAEELSAFFSDFASEFANRD